MPKPVMLKSWNWIVVWRPTSPSITNIQKRCPLHYKGLECKRRKSRDTWSKRQIWPWSTKWSRAKANRVWQENAQITANTLFHNAKDKSTHPHPVGQCWNQIDYMLCSWRWRGSKQPAATTTTKEWELAVAQIVNSLLLNSDLSWRK